jgi:predicted nuclease with TOPRIM domain
MAGVYIDDEELQELKEELQKLKEKLQDLKEDNFQLRSRLDIAVQILVEQRRIHDTPKAKNSWINGEIEPDVHTHPPRRSRTDN